MENNQDFLIKNCFQDFKLKNYQDFQLKNYQDF